MIKIQDIMRAGHIKRWNIVNTTRSQSLAEHMYNVTMIAQTLCNDLEREDLLGQVVRWALVHDVPEVVCGDTPTPAKRHMKEAGFDIEDVYDKIDPTYKDIKDNTNAKARYIVKIADLIEAYWFIREHGVGDHAKMIADNLYNRINESTVIFFPKGKDQGVVIGLMNRIVSGEFYE